MTDAGTALNCLIVSLLWGATNPLIKNSTQGITKVKAQSSVGKFINEVKYLAANWKYLIFFLINQLGSVLYFVLLQSVDLSLIVPIVNALTFVVTGIVGSILGEGSPNLKTLFGIFLILSGITLCVIDKVRQSIQDLK